jgi:replication initiation and membrane attachment protein
MLRNTRFFAIKKYAFNLNHNFLYDLYAPIIGPAAINLFINLVQETDKQIQTMGIAGDINNFFKQIDSSLAEFTTNRSKLEAINLLKTYIQVNPSNDQTTYTFLINEPLNFTDFVSNQKFRHLLIKSIGQINYERLEFVYNANRVPSEATNVSTTFENVFNDADIVKVSEVNFQEIYAQIAKNTSIPIMISDNAKSIIASYLKTYDLSLKEIQHAIYNCIVLNDDNQYHVDTDLLQLFLDKLVKSVNNINLLKNVQVNRNNKMFIEHLQLEELQQTFNDYVCLNAEQYLRAIIKTPLSSEDIETINTLREKYQLTDYIINLLIDYTMFKSNGNLNRKYILKVAHTVNALNLKTLKQIYDHFHFASHANMTFQPQDNAKPQQSLAEEVE